MPRSVSYRCLLQLQNRWAHTAPKRVDGQGMRGGEETLRQNNLWVWDDGQRRRYNPSHPVASDVSRRRARHTHARTIEGGRGEGVVRGSCSNSNLLLDTASQLQPHGYRRARHTHTRTIEGGRGGGVARGSCSNSNLLLGTASQLQPHGCRRARHTHTRTIEGGRGGGVGLQASTTHTHTHHRRG